VTDPTCVPCGDSGLLDYTVERHGRAYTMACRCLCEKGQLGPAMIPSADRVLEPLAIGALWPEGRPAPPLTRVDAVALERAGVPPMCRDWTLASYAAVAKGDPEATRYLAQAHEWASATGRRADVVLFGLAGTGKTGLAIAMLRARMELRERGLFIRARQLLLALRETFGKDAETTEAKVMREHIEAPVLVLDELDASIASDFGAGVLAELIDTRQKHYRPTLITMNIVEATSPREAIGQIADAVGVPVFDRLREHGWFWPFVSKSKRPTNVVSFGAAREAVRS
jgi:hypothetical protein